MAEDDQDDSQKTEDPTEKRLKESREKGQVAKSQEIGHWFMLIGLTVVIGLLGRYLLESLSEIMVVFLKQPQLFDVSGRGVHTIFVKILVDVGTVMAAILGPLIVFALVSSIVQVGINVSSESLKPKLSKISLLSGAKRIFGIKGWVEFIKGLGKITLVGMAIFLVVWPDRDKIGKLSDLSLPEILLLLQSESVAILIAVVSVMTIIALADYGFQKFQNIKELRMSRQDVKDEMKQSEGDPLVKARLRQLRTERARRRMMAAVPDADVVITNPTHYAIALKYDPATMAAPQCVAKGIDHLAERIKDVAGENDVPMVENRPLARALYDVLEVDQSVPAEHFKAIAEIISYVFRLKNRMSEISPPGQGAR
jgi:flagellar biosynthetic protein FlhB|tara:strand:- start:2238 stop:3341 length:1104 start_codon:yes stop_codon:yes gene_type:complete